MSLLVDLLDNVVGNILSINTTTQIQQLPLDNHQSKAFGFGDLGTGLLNRLEEFVAEFFLPGLKLLFGVHAELLELFDLFLKFFGLGLALLGSERIYFCLYGGLLFVQLFTLGFNLSL